MSHIANDRFNDEQEAIRQDKEAFMEEVEIDRAKTLLGKKGYQVKKTIFNDTNRFFNWIVGNKIYE